MFTFASSFIALTLVQKEKLMHLNYFEWLELMYIKIGVLWFTYIIFFLDYFII